VIGETKSKKIIEEDAPNKADDQPNAFKDKSTKKFENLPDAVIDFRAGTEDDVEGSLLTPAEQVELSGLLKSGFGHWSKRDDFQKYIGYMETFTKDNLEAVAKAMKKSTEEVRDYTQIFLAKIMTLEGSKKYLARVVKGELKGVQDKIITKVLDDDIRPHGDTWTDIRIPKEISRTYRE
jgi:hypothetical protein